MTLLPFNEPEYLARPYPYWDRLREEAPVFHSPEHGFWALTRYDDVVDVLHDPERFSSKGGPAGSDGGLFLPMIQHDPPQHDRLRRILSRAFTPRIIAERADRVQQIADDLVAGVRDKLARGEAVDLVRDFASPLPVSVIAEILGIPEEDRAQLGLWNDATTVTGAMTNAARNAPRTMLAMVGRLGELIERRRRTPADDLFTALIEASESDESPLEPRDLVGLCQLLWVAGNETTANLISNVAVLLQEQPELLAAIAAHPKAFVDEALRHQPPVNGLFRDTTCAVEMRGETIAQGARVILLFAAANRDPRQFERPNDFDPTRGRADHVAFGHGIHFCLGSHLARLEARVAFAALAELLPEVQLDVAAGHRIPTGVLRGWLTLPVTPAERAAA